MKLKIRLVTLPRLGLPDTSAWRREQTQRDAIHVALGDAMPDDVVLILDADDIPSRGLCNACGPRGSMRRADC